jgi:integrase
MNKVVITHMDVRDKAIKLATEKGKSKDTIKNMISSHSVYLQALKKTVADSADDLANTEIALSIFKEKSNLSDATWPSKKSHLVSFCNAYAILFEFNKMPLGFSERLAYLIKSSGKQIIEISQETGVSRHLIGLWRKCYKRPSQERLSDVRKLENYFRVQEGTLLGQLPNKLYGSKIYTVKNLKRSKHGKFTKLANREAYALYDWPEEAKSFWMDMLSHFTSGKPKVYSKKARIILIDGYYKNEQALWSSENTIKLKLWHISSFFGFLMLPSDASNSRLRGLGFKFSEINFALFTCPDLVEKYFAFRAERARYGIEKQKDGSEKIVELSKTPIYSNELEKFLECLVTWTKTKSGYLRQRTDLQKYVDTQGLPWESWVEKALNRYVQFGHTYNFVTNRKMDDKIGFILKDPNPGRYLKILLEGLMNEVLKDPEQFKITHRDIGCYMDYIICALFIANPLRMEMYVNMKIGENLYKDNQNNWRIRFNAEDFKNCKGAAKNKVYNEPVPPWACKIIDDYLKYYRPLCIGGKTNENGQYYCDYLYRPIRSSRSHKGSSKYLDNAPLAKNSIRNRVQIATLRYLPETQSGFSPHAFRHIVATDYIKAHPHSFEAVAGILHDTIETVRKNYGHVNSEDWIREYNKYTENYISDLSGKDQNDYDKVQNEKLPEPTNELKKIIEKQKKEIEKLKEESMNNQLKDLKDKIETLLNDRSPENIG